MPLRQSLSSTQERALPDVFAPPTDPTTDTPPVAPLPRAGTSRIIVAGVVVSLLTSLAALAVALDPLSSKAGDLFAPPEDPQALILRLSESTVDIACGDGGGTGFALLAGADEASGMTTIVTNYHVIDTCWEDGDELTVYTGADRDRTPGAEIVGVDEDNDLALIDIDEALPVIPAAETFAEPGWWVMALGNPYDPDLDVVLQNFATFGHIGYVLDYYWNYSSAVINPGNSGGPLVNSRGELIGINTLGGASTEDGIWSVAVDSDILCEELLDCPDTEE